MLEREFKYYIDNQADLVKKYNDKFIVIKDEAVVGVYDNELTAYLESKNKYPLGTFLIQHCQSGKESYTQVFHSNAIF